MCGCLPAAGAVSRSRWPPLCPSGRPWGRTQVSEGDADGAKASARGEKAAASAKSSGIGVAAIIQAPIGPLCFVMGGIRDHEHVHEAVRGLQLLTCNESAPRAADARCWPRGPPPALAAPPPAPSRVAAARLRRRLELRRGQARPARGAADPRRRAAQRRCMHYARCVHCAWTSCTRTACARCAYVAHAPGATAARRRRAVALRRAAVHRRTTGPTRGR